MWLEISLTVPDGELAEAVADVLGRYIDDGVFIQATGVVFDPDSEGRGIGPYRVCGYLPQDAMLAETRRKIEEGLWYLGRIQPLPEPEYTSIEETSWVDTWKQHYHPIRVGKKLTILPIWAENPTPDTLPILIDPGMAFGTGTHPTTQLTLELMEVVFDNRPPDTVIDIGCGSAILSIAAIRLGAQSAVAVDVDADAIKNARQNLRTNGVEDRVTAGVGSVPEVLAGEYPLHSAPLVVANILVHILIRLLDQGLADLVEPGGSLLLSGILTEREDEMLAALEKHGLEVKARVQMGDWVAYEVIHSH